MKSKTKFLAVVFCFISYLSLIAGSEESTNKDETEPTRITPQRNLSLPKLFEFNTFKRSYTRSYSSLTEEMARRRIYLGRAIQVFVKAILYKQRKSDSYLGINQFSDRTPKELSMIVITNNVGEDSSTGKAHVEEQDLGDNVWTVIPLVDTDDIKKEMNEIQEHSDEPGYKEMAEEVGIRVASQSREPLDVDKRQSLHLDDLMGTSQQADKESNKNYVKEDAKHDGSSSFVERFVNSMSKKLATIVSKVSNFKLFNSMVKDQVVKPDAGSLHDSSSSEKIQKESIDEIYIDHRDSKCFLPPKDQGYCASCYAFANIALYEWAHCMATDDLVAFSEQYIIDCGGNHFDALRGCQGGSVARVGEFVGKFGLELQENYPYIAKSYDCPYSRESSPNKMGFMRVSFAGPETGEFSPEKIDFYLNNSPIIIGIKLDPLFAGYAGGVDLARNCKQENGVHAVLIVGSGRQDGEEYWLMRNSFSSDWGEKGYYKLNKRANCFDPEKGFLSFPKFNSNQADNRNPDYNGSEIESRRKLYSEFEYKSGIKTEQGQVIERKFRR